MALNTLLTISVRMAQGYWASTLLPPCAAVVSLVGKVWALSLVQIYLGGTLILLEKPLFKVPILVQDAELVRNMVAQSLCALDKEQQRRFLEPSNNFPQLHVFMGIVKTSGILLGVNTREGGIFPTFSRFNHSCVANAVYSWNEKLGRRVSTLSRLSGTRRL